MFKRILLATVVAVSLVACGGGGSGGVDSVGHPTVTGSNNDYKTLDATGVRVIDGDTVEITLANAPSERIRLLGIDAPESDQPYGSQSTANLSDCVLNKKVTVQWNKKDRYSRIVGKVMADGKDCNLKQIEDGYAWHYKQYQSEQSKQDRLAYNNAEVFAKNAKKGLWAGDCIIAPWDWRKGVKTCKTNTLPEPPKTTDPVIPQPPVFDQCSSLRTKTCGQMANCTEAYSALNCGNKRIDGDKDGVPCESLCR